MYYTARDKCPHVLPKLEEFIRSIIAERNNQNQMKASMEDVLNRFVEKISAVSLKSSLLFF
jgi:hypothetical protein